MPVFRTLAAFFLCATLASAAELRTLSGKTLKGELVSVNDKEIALRTEAGVVVTPVADVLLLDLQQEITGPPPGSRYALVRLLDDTLVRCSKVTLQGNQVELALLSGQTAKVPLSSL